MPNVVFFFYVYVALSLTLASFCAIDKRDPTLTQLYAGETVSTLSLLLFFASGSYHFGALGGIVFLIICSFPIAHRTVGWVYVALSAFLFRRYNVDPALGAVIRVIHARRCRIFGAVLLFLYAAFFVFSLFKIPDGTFRQMIKVWHILIIILLLSGLALLRNPILRFVGKRW